MLGFQRPVRFGIATDAAAAWHLLTLGHGNPRGRQIAAGRHVDETNAQFLEAQRQFDRLLDVPAAGDPVGGGNAHEQRQPGGFVVWANPFTCLRAPKVFNLRMDPFERADIVSDQYYDWLAKNAYLIPYGVSRVAPFLQTFKEYPPSQRSASFSIDQMVDTLMKNLDKTGTK